MPETKRLIGLTGGIATGKSTVSDYLAKTHFLPVLDADLYAREATALGSPILTKIQEHYGQEILQNNGELDREKLGEIIFKDSQEKQWLESQIHPFVRQQFDLHLQQLEEPIIVLSIPLLFEAHLTSLVTEIWVVYCSAAQQRSRLINRNGLTPEQARDRLQSQWPLSEKIKKADVLLDNDKD
ncbi:MAG: dephospho-CoA kinase, partial [Microcystaceae cyanobacterium]